MVKLSFNPDLEAYKNLQNLYFVRFGCNGKLPFAMKQQTGLCKRGGGGKERKKRAYGNMRLIHNL